MTHRLITSFATLFAWRHIAFLREHAGDSLLLPPPLSPR